ncbi:putative protein TPRXL [Diaphorina citri]|uniref:Uncharacterized protein n=1 Tax=Diaphorina citri TaxID=121845 RepID=A0A1S4ED64_DIACI|nr:putative protein TPRXL [Diaphorina citri]
MATEEKYNDIRFNLMAVVPDKRLAISHKLTLLKANRTIVLEVLDKMKRKNNVGHIIRVDVLRTQPLLFLLAIEIQADEAKAGDKSHITEDNQVKSSESVEAAGSSQHKMELSAESDKPSTSTAPPLPSTSTDYFTPLTIQTTSTSPLTSCTSSLEDSCTSELSSAHDSPCMRAGVVGSPGMSSPGGRDMKKFVVIRVAMGTNNSSSGRSKKDGSIRKVCLEVGALPKGWEKTSKSSSHSPSSSSKGPLSPSSNKSAESPSSGGSKGLKSGGGESGSKKCESTFAPKDLQALVKNLEGEIAICEVVTVGIKSKVLKNKSKK